MYIASFYASSNVILWVSFVNWIWKYGELEFGFMGTVRLQGKQDIPCYEAQQHDPWKLILVNLVCVG